MPQRLIQKGLKSGDYGTIRSLKNLLKKINVIFDAILHKKRPDAGPFKISTQASAYFFLT